MSGAIHVTSGTRRRVPPSEALERPEALNAVPLHGRWPLHDLVASSTLQQRFLKPLAGSLGTGERDLARGRTPRIQYTAGSGPGSPPSISCVNSGRQALAGTPNGLESRGALLRASRPAS